ncbi:MAG: addiction module protein [Gemmataceae bacterium]
MATVFAAAESLSAAERRELVDLLTAGLDETAPALESRPPHLSEAWLAEIARRSAEDDAGEAGSVRWEEVQERWQARRNPGG